MHQEHNIPWNTLAANLIVIPDNNADPPPRTDIFARRKPSQARELTYFLHAFEKTVLNFAETERAKFPKSFEAPLHGKLFSDELRDHYLYILNEDTQLIEYWISQVRVHTDKSRSYDTWNGDLADAVMVLLYENQIDTLLMLANHPLIPLGDLFHLSCHYPIGISRLVHDALLAYVYINVITAMNLTMVYKTLSRYHSIAIGITALTNIRDNPHKRFFEGWVDHYADVDIFRDLPRLRNYLKELFRFIYQYALLERECKLKPKWQHELFWALGYAFGIRSDYADKADILQFV